MYAQPFDTGTETAGYTLHSIVLAFQSFTGTSTLTVTVREGTADSPSDTVLYTLVNPSTYVAGLNEFTAPSNASLDANKIYHVVVAYASNSGGPEWFRVLRNDGLDSGAADGWSIDYAYLLDGRANPDGWIDGGSRAMKIQVKGTVNTGTTSTDATLSGLALENASDDSALTLDPVFATGTTSYTASVANGVETVTVKPTVNESHATVAYLDGSDAAIADADGTKDDQQVALVVGANTIKVKVTAQDTTTTETYTVTVTRRGEGICGRTLAVQTAILGKISGVSACADVTTANLAAITGTLSLANKSIAALAAGDFAGLTSVTRLTLNGNTLTGLPGGVFDELTAVTRLDLNGNALASLPDDVFDKLTLLTRLDLSVNELASLRAGVFDELTALTELNLNGNELASLRAGVFDKLTLLTKLNLSVNELSSLRAGVFDELTLLTKLDLETNQLSALPDRVFEKLTALTTLRLESNPGPDNDTFTQDFLPTAMAAATPATIPTTGGDVVLDAAGSGGAWGTNVTYAWALTDPSSGVTVTYDPDAASARTTATVPGSLTEGSTLTFTLTVTGRGGSLCNCTDTATDDVGIADASTDATLSGLALENADDDNAIALNETFATGTKSYTASVLNGVDEITVLPETTDAAATVEYLDDSDATITDSDTNKDDQQVELDVGANTIKVKVTAEDDATTETYTVVVTRAEEDATAPSPESAEVAQSGTSVTVTFSEGLDVAAENLPAAVVNAFTVTADGVDLDIDRVALIASNALAIRLPTGTTISENQTVKVSYDKTVAGADALEDANGNEVASFTDFAVTNNSTVVVAALPVLSVSPATALEGEALEFTVTLSAASADAVTVAYAATGVTATAGTDFTAPGSGATLTIAAGQTTETITIDTLTDAEDEDAETLTLTLSAPQNATLGTATATGTIDETVVDVGAVLYMLIEPDPNSDTALTVKWRSVYLSPRLSSERITDYDIQYAEELSGWPYRVDGEDWLTVTYPRWVNRMRWQGWSGTIESFETRSLHWLARLEGLTTGQAYRIRMRARTADGPGPWSLARPGQPRRRGSQATALEPLTAAFEDVPEGHDGSSAFTLRLAFSDEVALDEAGLRAALLVSNGAVTGVDSVSADLWEITIQPNRNDSVSVLLSPPSDCEAAGAICTDDGRKLSAGLGASVPFVPQTSQQQTLAPLTASFVGVPGEHTGETFTFGLTFSEELKLSFRRLRDAAFDVSGGTVRRAKRQQSGSDRSWTIHVEPDSDGTVTIELPETTNCNATGAICTADDRPLSHALSAAVAGPVAISVADARVDEGTGAVLAFAVTLSRAASRTVTVDYATADGSAHAGVDYTAANGTLTFQPGASSQTIDVAVLDDSHDEAEETLTLTLSNASGGRVADGEATGTIKNRDPLPRALLARFGRTAAVHVVEHVEERLQAPRGPGFRGEFAGRELRRGMERDIALDFLHQLGASAGAYPAGAGLDAPMDGSLATGAASVGMAGLAGGGPMAAGGGMAAAAGPMGAAGGPMSAGVGRDGGFGGGRGLLRMGLGGGDLLTGSSFALNRETRHGGILSFWSRGAQSHFAGREGALSLSGAVRTSMFGADYAKGPLVAGLSLSHSRSLGEYAGVAGGQVASSVTGLYPWLGYKATDRMTVWGVAGYGGGGLLLTPERGMALESGLSMAMAAAGTRGELIAGGAGGFALAFKADALWVGTSIDGVDGPAGRLAATEAAVTRFRTGLEGSRDYMLAGRLSLKPSVEVGLRHDGGDAETGAGMDVGAGLIVSDSSTGLAVDVRVRTLLVHQAEGFSERSMALSLSYNPTPSTPLGFMARVAPSWGGQARSGAEALWGRETMGGMAHGSLAAGNRLDGEVGYGLPLGSHFVGTPRVSFSASEHGRDYRVGYGLGVLDRESLNFELSVDAQRRENPMQGGADQGVVGRASLGW